MPLCSSYRKESPRVILNYRHQLYLLMKGFIKKLVNSPFVDHYAFIYPADILFNTRDL